MTPWHPSGPARTVEAVEPTPHNAAEPFTLDPATTIALVLDVQRHFLTERTAHVVTPIALLVDELDRVGIPVLFSRYVIDPDNPCADSLGRSGPAPGAAAALASELSGRTTRDFRRSSYSPFTADVLAQVEARQARDVLVLGVDTGLNLLTAMLEAAEHQLRPTLVRDCSASLGGAQRQDAAHRIVTRALGEDRIQSTAGTLTALAAHARHDAAATGPAPGTMVA